MTIKARRLRADFLRELGAIAADGHKVDPADVEQLPASVRAEAQTIFAHVRSLHRGGYRGAAHEYARHALHELADNIDDDWSPPRVRPDMSIVDEIRGGF